MPTPILGHVSGVDIGAECPDRSAFTAAGVHRQPQAGITETEELGAESIVLHEGYEDDRDFGDEILYSLAGADVIRTPADKLPTRLLRQATSPLQSSELNGAPVRVIRGPRLRSQWRPPGTYRYDGLYRVEEHWQDRGVAGYRIWRYRLVKLEGEPLGIVPPPVPPPPGRRAATIQRVIRSTEVVNLVKRLHDYRCQVCGDRLETSAGPYAEGAHIRPVGRPHDGPDVPVNVLCLCPNHHVLFDTGSIFIRDDLTLFGAPGHLRSVPDHPNEFEYLRYHPEHYSPDE